MVLFHRKKNKKNSYSPYSQSDSSINNDNLDKDESHVGIKFKKELSNGSLVFLIVDDDFDWLGGYVIVSANGVANIVDNIVDNKFKYYSNKINSTISSRLKKTAEAFYYATTK